MQVLNLGLNLDLVSGFQDGSCDLLTLFRSGCILACICKCKKRNSLTLKFVTLFKKKYHFMLSLI